MKLLLATKNMKKLDELQRILSPMGVEVICERDLEKPLPDVVEDGLTFEENAYKKAYSAMKATGFPSVADDSGLCVDALEGAPGIYSARFAGEQHSDEDNNDKLLAEMKDIPDSKRTARFVSAICCVFPNGDKIDARGECHGKIGYERTGQCGFGYDPLFMVGDKSFGQLTKEEKDKISHRGVALRAFADLLKGKK